MQQAPLDMLVDHYPLRSVVDTFGTEYPSSAQSARLLAEAMAGSEVLVAVEANGGEPFVPLTFSIGGKQYLVAGTSAEYAKSQFMNYLADRIVQQNIELKTIDARDLVIIAIALGRIDAILFDMETTENEESLGEGLAHSSLFIDGLARKSAISPSELLESGGGEPFQTIPTLVLSMLARESSESECQSILFDYLSRCTKEELRYTMVFIGVDKDGDDATFTTLARGFKARLLWDHQNNSDDSSKEQRFSLINMWTWLTSLVEQPYGDFHLDSIKIDNSFAHRVITAVESP